MFFRIFKYSVKNTLRNKFLSISSVLVLTLLMFFINILVLLNDVSSKLIDGINSKLTISLYVDEKYTKTSLEITDFIDDIKTQNAGVVVEYKTKDDIINEIRLKEPNLVKILERNNPLPDTIVLSNIGISEYKKINELVESRLYLLVNDQDQKDYFANYTTQYKKIEDVTSILDVLQFGLNIIILIFIVSIAIIIYSIIGNFIYYYRDEIYITKLVGGSNIFIYGPFVLQGIIYSFSAFLCNIILFVLLLNNLNGMFGTIYTFSFSNIILLLEMLMFTLVGGISGYFSSKKYLR
ncbi:MAG: hypothetical protein PHH98_05475 [Candidatus Gracilibacteria bacterium]|nr:hypothetical protein [Candidatus Gracilibacteria bacterium]